MGEGEKVRTNLGVKALRSLEQADLPPGDELIHLVLRIELLSHLGRERPHVRAVLLEDLGFAFRERHVVTLLLVLGALPESVERLAELGVISKLLKDLLREVF